MRRLSITAIVISMLLVFTIAVPSFATDKVSGKCGQNVSWTLDRTTGVFTISGNGAMYDYDYYKQESRPWNDYIWDITTVKVDNGVSRIGKRSFAGAGNIKKLTMADSVKSIGDSAFENNSKLADVQMSQGLNVIEEYAFLQCMGIKQITLPDSLISVGEGCFVGTALSEVKIPKSATTVGERAFGFYLDCPNLGFKIYGYPGSAAEKYTKSYTYEMFASDYPEYRGKSGEIFQFIKIEESIAGFYDVLESAWYAEPVDWAVSNDITNGTGKNIFSPNMTCTTGQILTFLWRAAGREEPIGTNPFSDVKEKDYFYKPALWAYEHNIIGAGELNANLPCTRANTVLYLWKLSGSPDAGMASFSDVSNNVDYATAVSWAVEQSITSGTDVKHFSPSKTCTRGQIVTFLYRWINSGTVLTDSTSVKRAYSDNELCDLAKAYYRAKNTSTPPYARIDHTDGNMVLIQLYEVRDNHTSTWEWYTVDRNTGRGSSMFSGDIDLTSV